MENAYWQRKWQNGDIRFHQNKVHPSLPRYLGSLKDRCVLVPLCGKSLDMLWLLEQGHEVIGVELSEIACRSFFEEHQLAYEEQSFATESGSKFKIFKSQRIELWCGDFFELPRDPLRSVNAIYDRAALIALPNETRLRYARTICDFANQSAQAISYLLVTIEYNQARVQGPPFSVSADEVRMLFGQTFQIQHEDILDANALADHPKFLGISAVEKAYLLGSPK